MKIKDRLTQEIEAAKNNISIRGTLKELELSKSRPNHFQKRIYEIKQEMTKEVGIADNWVANGCFDINYKDWIEQVIELNLKDRPENEVWQEVQLFLKHYFLILEYERFIKGNEPIVKQNKGLTVPQIALIHAYRHDRITRENANEIAAKHGYKSKNSGEGLFQDFEFYWSPSNRKARTHPFTRVKMKNKILLFESVINYLIDSKIKELALMEIEILKEQYEEVL